MKLVHLLATTLEEWPEGVKYITQNGSDNFIAGWKTYPLYDRDGWCCGGYVTVYDLFDEDVCCADDYQTARITEDYFLEYKEYLHTLAEDSKFNTTPMPDEVDTSPWKIYPTQIEVVDDEGDVVLQLETADSATCTIKINHYLIGNNDVDKLCEMIRKGVTMLELE